MGQLFAFVAMGLESHIYSYYFCYMFSLPLSWLHFEWSWGFITQVCTPFVLFMLSGLGVAPSFRVVVFIVCPGSSLLGLLYLVVTFCFMFKSLGPSVMPLLVVIGSTHGPNYVIG